jgi:hypothetical protein
MITYEYYPATKPDGSPKPGVNRITYINNEEITREYFEVDPRETQGSALQAVMQATPEEIEQIKSILGL